MWYLGTNPKFGVRPAPTQGNRKICGPCWDSIHADCELAACECLCRVPIELPRPAAPPRQEPLPFPQDKAIELPRVRHGK